ncbi:MAG: hypothetical protein ACXWLH_03030 [Candidatus Saccharimonadales bacterium]
MINCGRESFQPPEEWLKVETLLDYEQRFLRMQEIINSTGLPIPEAYSTIDHMFRRGAVRRRYSLDDIEVIVSARDIIAPEFGHTKTLHELFAGKLAAAGIVEVNYADVETSYGLSYSYYRGFNPLLLPAAVHVSRPEPVFISHTHLTTAD